jgi:hypothetical protein
MDGRKDTLTDAALDREIESLLAVDPSPEFVARIRARVADQPVASGWRWQLPMAAAVAVTAIVVAIVMWRPTATGPSVVAPVQEAGLAHPAPPSLSAVAQAPKDSPRVAVRRDVERVARQRVATPAAPLPEVLIPENEKRGFQLFLEELSDEKNAAVIAEAASGRTTPGPPWLDVAPVVIEPLHEVSAFQGEGQ